MVQWRGIFALGALALSVSVRATEPPAPSTQSQKPKPGMAVANAVVALTKEFQAYVKDPKASPLREKPNYFIENRSSEATPEAIVKALEGSVSGGPSAEGYVKWQLLSGIPGKFPDDLYKRAVAVYRRAPLPGEHPGLDHKSLSRAVNGAKKERIAEFQKELDHAVGQVNKENRLILVYRDQLFARMPYKYEALSAGLEDAGTRAVRGLNANPIFDNVAAGIRSWTVTESKSGQVRAMIDTLGRLADSVASDNGKPYTKLYDEKGILRWKAEISPLDPKKLEELAKFLQSNSGGASAGGGLKFKETKDK